MLRLATCALVSSIAGCSLPEPLPVSDAGPRPDVTIPGDAGAPRVFGDTFARPGRADCDFDDCAADGFDCR